MTHIMIDLETWGRRPGCDIRSIGAVVFDPLKGRIPADETRLTLKKPGTFYIATDNPAGVWINGTFDRELQPKRSERRFYLDLHREPETVQWWSEQSEEAQAAFADPVELREACNQFGYWLGRMNDGEALDLPDSTLKIWANDPHFDVSILSEVYRVVGLPQPWHYRAPRSMKTITDAAGMTRDDFKPFDHGTQHNALDDAISQARIVCEAYRRLGLVDA